jgi:capsular exopolysaccharide synthesis family protein
MNDASTLPPGNQVEEGSVDLRRYFSIFMKYKWNILGLTLMVYLLAVVYTNSLTPIYTATTTLLIDTGSDKAKLVSIEEIYSVRPSNKFFQTQIRIITSRPVIEKLVTKLELIKHPEFDPHIEKPKKFDISAMFQDWLPKEWSAESKPVLSDQQIFDMTVKRVQDALSVNMVSGSDLMNISFSSPDRELAAKVPNALADIYIENDMEARLAMTRKATSWLTERLDSLRQKLSQSEEDLQNYLESQELVDVSGVKSIAAAQLTATNNTLFEARQTLAQARTVYQQVQALKGKPMNAYETIPEIIANPLYQSVKQLEVGQERKVSELSQRYGKKHPTMIAALSKLESAKQDTKNQIRKLIASIEKNYQAAQNRVALLENNMKSAEDKIQSISRKEFRLSVLEREVETNRQLYDLFLKRLKETGVSPEPQSSTIGRVINPALVPGAPTKPQKQRIILIVTLVGFLFATALVFVLEFLDNTINSAEDVEEKLGTVLLGVLPRIKNSKSKQKVEFMVLQDDKSPFAESIRTIRTGIMLSGLDNPHKVLLVTSSVPSEGKSTFAMNQALALGQLKKTLLIDADLRRPSIGKNLGLSVKTPGLTELVAGEKPFNECVQRVEGLSVDILLSGMIPPNPLELLSSKHFKDTLSQLEQEYEQIVIDTAPAHAVSDALVLSSYAKALVYVIKADSTPHQVALAGLRRLQQAKAPVLGVILNQFEPVKSSKYYGKYGYYSAKSYYGSYNYS